MPKTRTLRAAQKRFKVRSSGGVSYKHSGARHLLTKKSPKKKRQLRATGTLKACDQARIQRCLPNA